MTTTCTICDALFDDRHFDYAAERSAALGRAIKRYTVTADGLVIHELQLEPEWLNHLSESDNYPQDN
jgi:hypothetical protein